MARASKRTGRAAASPEPPVAGIVLAAGLARRFGGPKLAAALEGRPLLAHVLDTARAAREAGLLDALVAVLPAGPEAPEEAALLRRLAEERGATVVLNDAPAAGLSRSLRLGLAAVAALEDRSAEAALVLLGDQPRTRLDAIRALVEEWRLRRAPILVPRYADARASPARSGRPAARATLGNPVVLGREAWPLARRLRGDSGMRAVARRHPELVSYLDVEGANRDVDRPADLAALAASPPGSLG